MASIFEVRATLAKVLTGTACNCGQALTDNALLCRTFQALHPHPEERLHLRMHRARSVVLTSQELVEIRAAQRTFEGAYMRTALSLFSFSLVVLKIFTSEFYPIGALLACYGAAVLLVAVYRRYEGNRQFFDCEEEEYEEQDEQQQQGYLFTNDGSEGRGREEGTRGHRAARQVVVKKKFRTNGNSVGLLVGLSLVSYVALVVLLWELVE
ncbi:hypothetical protein C7999DRAFT_27006 [Corynascus novoguineensis]|uniref:DUF202 domain-containing protein n=1 Tax=Corynascus novoguineensis TaxID=1126955 RepID=A0AAN7D5J6_9PEZI|nr:hypothetical protein C7999DRAFT_27006 [Corynascus novoguineensis]